MRASLALLDVLAVGDLIRRREVTATELLQATLERLDRIEPELHAFITVDREGARQAAAAADRELAAGTYRGPLHGVPVSVKDNFATKGLRTTSGSVVFASWVPDHDAAVVERLRAAGAVLLGKASMFELASGWQVAPPFPPTLNPFDSERTPTGSSSGSAVAVATGLGQVSVGSDSGGSVRGPACYAGVVGLKPTYGLVSSYGLLPDGPSLAHVGTLTRTVADAAAVLAVLAGHDLRDPASVAAEPGDLLAALEAGAAGLRIGVPWAYVRADIDPRVEEAFELALTALTVRGARLVDLPLATLEAGCAAWPALFYVELARTHAERYRARPQDFGAEVARRIQMGLATSAADHAAATRLRDDLRAEILEAFRDVDIIATPTMPAGPPHLATVARSTSAPAALASVSRFLRPPNLTGIPALTLPCGRDRDGNPIGLQLAAAPFAEGVLLRAARAYERARGPWSSIALER